MSTFWRATFCIACMVCAYQLIQLHQVRAIYTSWDKVAHALAFFSIWWGLRWCFRWPVWMLSGLSLGLGAAVEVHQYFLPGFNPSLRDWLADAIGIAAAAGLFLAWDRYRPAPLARFEAAVLHKGRTTR